MVNPGNRYLAQSWRGGSCFAMLAAGEASAATSSQSQTRKDARQLGLLRDADLGKNGG